MTQVPRTAAVSRYLASKGFSRPLKTNDIYYAFRAEQGDEFVAVRIGPRTPQVRWERIQAALEARYEVTVSWGGLNSKPLFQVTAKKTTEEDPNG